MARDAATEVDVTDVAADALEDSIDAPADSPDDVSLDAIDDVIDEDAARDAPEDSDAAPLDASVDAIVDAPFDASVDVFDATLDATLDALGDARSDAAFDAAGDVARDATADAPDACPSFVVTCTPAASCRDHLSQGRTANGFYYVDHDGRPDTAPLIVECDMSLGGWTRLFRINGSLGCPGPLRHDGVARVCARPSSTAGSIISLPVPNFVRFREVQARAALLGYAGVDAFTNPAPQNTWATFYVDGVSLFAREPGAASPSHVWTWAVAGMESYVDGGVNEGAPCPCRGGAAPVPEVGRSYYCAATLNSLAATMPNAWREPITTWVTAGTTDACASGAPMGRYLSSSMVDSSASFEIRLIVSGASPDAPGGGEDVGIRDFDLLVR